VNGSPRMTGRVGSIVRLASLVVVRSEKRKSYPACRPTMAQCTSAAKKKKSSKRINWKAKGGLVRVF